MAGNPEPIDALGAWQPDRALPMTLDVYPFWRTSVEVPEGAVFEMRWLRKRDGVVVAEAADVLYGVGQPGPSTSGRAR